MPDLDLIKQAEQGTRDRRGRFSKGRSRNPAGRPRGRGPRLLRLARNDGVHRIDSFIQGGVGRIGGVGNWQ